MEKTNIKVEADNCAECLVCQLWCSFTYADGFNPLKARIVIETPTGLDWHRKISFTDECIKDCFLCAQHCVYGALTPIKIKE